VKVGLSVDLRGLGAARNPHGLGHLIRAVRCQAGEKKLCTPIASCKRQHIEPFAYLRDLFTRISYHPHHRLDELLPDKWLVAQRKISSVHEET